jgi:hypothetical protein
LKNERLQVLPIQFEETKTIDNRFTLAKIYLMHTGKNLKGSYFQKSVVEAAFDSLKNTPVLGYIKIDENNEKDFEGHKSILVVEDGDYIIKYAGSAYGVIPESCNPRWEMKTCDDGIEREFLVVDCILWSSKFIDVKDIFDRDVKKSQSMELDDSFSGFERPDGYFEFSSILFYGACVLGNSRTPAMTGASIEVKFSTEEFQEEIQKNMESLKNILINQNQDNNFDLNINNSQKEGGTKNLEEKLKLVAKYSNLTEDDIKDLKTNIDKYSLEEFDTELKKISDGKFEMTSEQLRTALRQALSEKTEIKNDYWGDPYQSQLYYFCDIITNNILIVIDNSWDNYFGIPFTISGDTVELDYENKVAYLSDWRVKESGSAEFSVVKEIVEAQIKFSIEKAEEKIKATFNAIETQEYKDLQSKFSTLETEKNDLQSKFTILETEKTTLETKCSEFEAENATLKTFQQDTITTQRTNAENALFEMFSEKLTEEELQPFKEKVKDFTIEQLEEKLYAFVAKKTTKFEHTQKPKLNVVFDRNNIEIKTTKPYDDILQNYVAKE